MQGRLKKKQKQTDESSSYSTYPETQWCQSMSLRGKMIISECQIYKELTEPPTCVVVVETYKSACWAERVRAHRADAPAPTSGPLQESDKSPVNT